MGQDSDRMMWFVSRGFEVTLKDAWDGTVTVQLYVDEGSGYESARENGYREYEGTEEEGGTWKDNVLYIFGDGSDNFITADAKLVMNYTTKDGISGQTESDVFKLAKGRFVTFGRVSRDGSAVKVRITAASEAGTVELLTHEENTLTLTVGGEKRTFTEPIVTADGQDIILKYNITDTEISEGITYIFEAEFLYDLGDDTALADYVFKKGTLD